MRLLITKQPTETENDGHNADDCRVHGCERCALKKPFELPPEIVSACFTGKLVIFAGAGVSTESKGVYPPPFIRR